MKTTVSYIKKVAKKARKAKLKALPGRAFPPVVTEHRPTTLSQALNAAMSDSMEARERYHELYGAPWLPFPTYELPTDPGWLVPEERLGWSPSDLSWFRHPVQR